jgi:tRNA(Met) cytidine acetyltransferase
MMRTKHSRADSTRSVIFDSNCPRNKKRQKSLETPNTQAGALAASDVAALARLTASLRTQASVSNHRLALVLAGSRHWTLSATSAAISSQPAGQIVWLTEQKLPGRCLSISQGHKLLGSELNTLVYDAQDGFDPDSFGAALGALRGGGLLLLLIPDPESWAGLPDPQAARVTVYPFAAAQVTGRFLGRIARSLHRSQGILTLSESAPHAQALIPPTLSTLLSIEKPSGDCRTPDQARAVAAIIATAHGRARRPLVLSSDRGRGKSSALGIAVARLLAKGRRAVLVTAPRRSAVDPIFQQASRLLPQAEVHANRIRHLDALVEFLPPDRLCRSRPNSDLLLVDEAAGIPAPLLERLLSEHSRVVFATTVHGYEGTGRGFEIRFRRILDRLTPLWRELRMETPVRWAPGDPLERFAAEALLLSAAPAPESQVADARPETCRSQLLDRDALAKDETTLSQLFGLLVLAHYQTRPMDLRHLLDGPNVRVYGLFHEGQIAATALVAVEGGFGPDLAREIFAGRRRPRGHLLPQTLSAHAGIQEAAALRYTRVVRIAVHPAVQGRGLGRLLLEGIVDDARGQGLDLAGSSFGATVDLLDFWEHCGFSPVHLGTSRNSASGANAAVVLQPLSPAGESLQKLASKRLAKRLPSLLAEPLRDLEPEIAACLLRNAPQSDWSPAPGERQEVAAFAFGQRTYEAVLPLLADLVRARIGQTLRAGQLDDSERSLLICKLLQHRGWTDTARLLGLTGRAQILTLLRAALGKLIASCESESRQVDA